MKIKKNVYKLKYVIISIIILIVMCSIMYLDGINFLTSRGYSIIFWVFLTLLVINNIFEKILQDLFSKKDDLEITNIDLSLSLKKIEYYYFIEILNIIYRNSLDQKGTFEMNEEIKKYNANFKNEIIKLKDSLGFVNSFLSLKLVILIRELELNKYSRENLIIKNKDNEDIVEESFDILFQNYNNKTKILKNIKDNYDIIKK